MTGTFLPIQDNTYIEKKYRKRKNVWTWIIYGMNKIVYEM